MSLQRKGYTRAVTHTGYKRGNKKGWLSRLTGRLDHKITKKGVVLTNVYLYSKKYYLYASDEFLEVIVPQNIVPFWGMGISLFMMISLFFSGFKFPDEKNMVFFVIVCFLSVFCFFFFALYWRTMPKKELILNRKDGLITFPGFMWHKNITMPVESVVFKYTGPNAQGRGAFQLLIERPDALYTKYDCFLSGKDCYEDLSFLLWYMDRNRPLPTGSAFNEYRQQDFERRKSEGFQKPLFPSYFPTPEATPEQDEERRRIGRW